jgi:hypothetical protein
MQINKDMVKNFRAYPSRENKMKEGKELNEIEKEKTEKMKSEIKKNSVQPALNLFSL